MVIDCKIIRSLCINFLLEEEHGLRIYRRIREDSQNETPSLEMTPLKDSATPSVSPDIISPSLMSE